MKRFDFRLKSVLLLRQRLLNESEQQYSRAIAARRATEAKIAAEWQELDRINAQMLADRRDCFVAAMQQGFLSFMAHSRQRIKALEQELRMAEQQEKKARAHYLEAHRNHELLLKLKDRQQREHIHGEFLKEQQQQDDLFNARRALSTGMIQS